MGSASDRRARTRSACSRRQRITAKDRYHALVDQLQYVARRELIFGMHIHVAIDDPDKAIQVVNGAASAARAAARAVGELALLARRADGSRLEPTDGVLRVPALRASAPLPRLRGLRPGRRPAGAHRLHRGLHAHLVGHPTAPAAGGRSRSGSATRSPASRMPSRSPRTSRRSSSSCASSTRPTASCRRSTGSSRARTSGSPHGTGSRRP